MNKKILTKIAITSIALSLISPTAVTFADSVKMKSITGPKIINDADAVKSLDYLPSQQKLKNNFDQYTVTKKTKDQLGYTHYTLEPTKNGVKAFQKEIKIHADENGKVVLVNGELNEDELNASNKPTLTKEGAIDAAFKSIGISQSEVSRMDKESPIMKAELNIDADKNLYIYNIKLSYDYPTASYWHIQIDASTGEVLHRQDITKQVATTARGKGLFGSYRPLHVTKDDYSGEYSLEAQRGYTKIVTYDGLNTNRQDRVIVTDSNRIFSDLRQRDAVDAHYFTNKVFEMYLNKFGHESYNGYGKRIQVVTHHKLNHNNAMWNGSAMYYGEGDGQEFTSLSAGGDIVAHEFTHAVTDYTADLIYQNQPGAMNEHISDVFAYFFDPDFDIGEDVYTPHIEGDALRSIKDPASSNQPDHMDFYLYTSNTPEGDYGGVHYNSGILNKAFYNMLAVENLELEKAEQIYWRALSQYLHGTSKFIDLKNSLMQASEDLYTPEDAQKVKRAFDAVGIVDEI